jgi:hypothetical protein
MGSIAGRIARRDRPERRVGGHSVAETNQDLFALIGCGA